MSAQASHRRPRTPNYRLHKPSGQAVVTLNGKDHYLGRYGSDESRAEYDRLIAEWLASGRRATPSAPGAVGGSDLTVNELLLAYLRFAKSYYRKGERTSPEYDNIKLALRTFRQLYGHTAARNFGPLALKAVRQAMIDAGLCRNHINQRVGRIVRVFKWAVENELVPPSVHHGLKAVSGHRKGRSGARESEPVRPVPEAVVEAIRPYVARQIWAMVQLQRFTGMRPGEVTIMRTCDLDTSGSVWVYTPADHKTAHHDRERKIYLGPRAQEILRPWLRTELTAYLFNPAEAMAERQAEKRRRRKTLLTPSQRARKPKANGERRPHERYSPQSYHHAIGRACLKAGVPAWHPHQLLHNAATWLRKEFGLDVARVILGHSSPAVTEVYAEVDREKALVVMEQVG